MLRLYVLCRLERDAHVRNQAGVGQLGYGPRREVVQVQTKPAPREKNCGLRVVQVLLRRRFVCQAACSSPHGSLACCGPSRTFEPHSCHRLLPPNTHPRPANRTTVQSDLAASGLWCDAFKSAGIVVQRAQRRAVCVALSTNGPKQHVTRQNRLSLCVLAAATRRLLAAEPLTSTVNGQQSRRGGRRMSTRRSAIRPLQVNCGAFQPTSKGTSRLSAHEQCHY